MMKRWRTLSAIGILTAGLATGLYFANQQRTGVFEVRKKAAEIQGSQLLFKGPQKVTIGEKFTVDLLLDTTTDPKYTISGVDAVVSYGGPQDIEGSGKTSTDFPRVALYRPEEPNPTGMSEEELRRRKQELQGTKMGVPAPPRGPEFLSVYAISLLSVTPGKIFDSYPTRTPACTPQPPCADEKELTFECNLIVSGKPPPGGGEWCPPTQFLNPVTVSGVKNYSVNDKGYFNGFTGQGIFATLTFVAQNPGKATIGLVYKGPSATDDTNVNGFLANQPVSLQKPQERLLTSPQTFAVEVVAPQPTPTPPCVQPPPECVDKSGNFTLCDPEPGVTWCRPTPTPKPTCTPPPPPCTSVPCPLYKPTPPRGGWCPPTPTPKPTCTPLPPCAYEGTPDPNYPSRRVFCAVDLPPGGWSCPRPTPTPTPQPTGKLSFTLSDTSGAPVRQTVKILAGRAYQMEASTNIQGATAYAAGFSDLTRSGTPSPQTPPPPTPPNRDNLVLLGETQTDASGTGQITIKNEYLSKPWALYAQTPSHLIRSMQVNIYPIWFSPSKTVDVTFDKLIAGDIYVAEGQNRQDGVINNFDVSDLFRQWGPYAQIQIYPPNPPAPADFNADGTVNNRDLVILLSNFGKKGDYPTPTTSVGSDTREGCLARSGVWQKWGLAQSEFCQVPAKDAGKTCTDGSQCSYGLCKGGAAGATQGVCAAYQREFGCYSRITRGKTELALCAD